MIKWIKNIFSKYKRTEQSNIDAENSYKARKHALLALGYWKDCKETSTLHFQIEDSSIYVRLGKDIDLYQAGQKKNPEK